MEPTPLVRPASLDDARRIAEVHVASWQSAYRGILPDTFLDGLSVEEWAERRRQWLSAPGRGAATLVAERNGGVVGFVHVCEARDVEGAGEVAAIYAAPTSWGTGVGRALIDAAVDELSAQGRDRAVLWVFRDNARGRAFYERMGWAPDGHSKLYDIAGIQATELRYARPLHPAPPRN